MRMSGEPMATGTDSTFRSAEVLGTNAPALIYSPARAESRMRLIYHGITALRLLQPFLADIEP